MCYLLHADIISFIDFDEVPLIKICALLAYVSAGGGLFRHLILLFVYDTQFCQI